MTTAAIICEYNPFHNGHLRQFALTRAALGDDTTLICLMSGNYVQRGEPALFDKAVRARAAVACGADLVLELPVTCALRSAEGFARGAVDILARLGCVDTLSFGCECGEAGQLQSIVSALASERFPLLLHRYLSDGLSFASARERAVQELTGLGALLRRPNNILAVEYCKALQRAGSTIEPLALRREGDYHSGETPDSPSASAVRARCLAGTDYRALVPPAAAACYVSAAPHALSYGERAVLARLRALDESDWRAVPFGTEGLWSKVMKAARTQTSIADILSASLSKRYPRTRLSRLLLCAFLGIDAQALDTPAPYVRALAFSDRGRALLRAARAAGFIPVIHTGEPGPEPAFGELERRAGALYGLFSAGAPECADETGRRIHFQTHPAAPCTEN